MKLFAAAGLLMCFGVTVQAAHAQEVCSSRTLVGTYAFQEKGSSTIIPSLTPLAAVPNHWAALIAPYDVMGLVTFPPEGDGEGFIWVRSGAVNSGSFKLPLQIQGSMNANCTGDFTATVTLPPGSTPSTETIVGHSFASVNGQDFYTIPTSASDPFLAWIGVGHRIGKGGNAAETCGPETAQGTYLVTAENIVPNPGLPSVPAEAFSDAILLRMDVSMSGEVTGVLYEKFGPVPFNDSDVTGTMTVNADCTYSLELTFKRGSTDVTPEIEGVFFNQGKGLYGVFVSGFPFSVVQGERISQ
jgi:hypothetical protein